MKNLILFLITGLYASMAFSQIHYPPTPKILVQDTLWGNVYDDNYRRLENMKDPKVVSWFKAEAQLTDSIMDNITGRDELIAEWRKLDALQPPVYYDIKVQAGRYFFQKSNPGEKASKVYYRNGINGKDELLFDPLTFIPGKTLSVESIRPSYDGSKLLLGYSEQGAEVSTLRVMDVNSKKFLPDEILATAGAGGWTFDNSSFFYTWIKSADNTDPAARLNPKFKLHRLGNPVSSDIDFFSNEKYPSLNIDSKAYPYAYLSKDAPDYIFSTVETVQREMALYYAPISEFNATINWKPLITTEDEIVRNTEFFDGKIYGITYKNAKNFQLVATDLKNPDWKNAEIVVPEKSYTLENFIRSKDYILLHYSDGLVDYLFKYNPKTKKTTEVKTPYKGSIYLIRLDYNSNEIVMLSTSWNKPFTDFIYNADTDQFSESSFNKMPDYPDSYTNLVVEEVEVKGHDGLMVPLSIIYQPGIKKDGSNVCYMEGYGAYGISMTPSFATRLYSMAVKGVVIAIPHVRGGSEKGEEWYKAGFKSTKPNTWKDFISCAEYLIDQGFTNSKKLAGSGTSAGGILISRAITERPDLFAAAVCNVGLGNAMRGEFSPNGPVNIPEFGTVTDPEETKALYEMDGMQHVKDGVKYPAVMCVAGWNDPRVVPWQPGKLAAALQNSSTSGKPVLLKINYDNGHFTDDKEVSWANFANQYAFLMWQCGHPEFHPKK
ncbi:S9 family peptidase [Aequorivita sp. H23M31]|uniref:prolyl oligopeptidase n=1 Tax=Aequorivita ciconiae TaxID=2494375 RepID=A0A410G193_9FLAO|nr:prolyl oligopeptidase family serine peptidase [Aequorivita sp. H23M31]QAA81048.1 S9 family peptidase [Aequorivita sp. H23M31]